MAEYGTTENPPSPDPSQLPEASQPQTGQQPPAPPPLSPEEEQARVLYSTYRLHVGGVDTAGVGMPQWEGLSIPMRNAWTAVHQAASGGSPPPPEGSTTSAPSGEPAVLWTQEDLEQLTVTDLRELCTQSGVTVSSSATKQQLIDALLAHQQSQASTSC